MENSDVEDDNNLEQMPSWYDSSLYEAVMNLSYRYNYDVKVRRRWYDINKYKMNRIDYKSMKRFVVIYLKWKIDQQQQRMSFANFEREFYKYSSSEWCMRDVYGEYFNGPWKIKEKKQRAWDMCYWTNVKELHRLPYPHQLILELVHRNHITDENVRCVLAFCECVRFNAEAFHASQLKLESLENQEDINENQIIRYSRVKLEAYKLSIPDACFLNINAFNQLWPGQSRAIFEHLHNNGFNTNANEEELSRKR